LELWEITENLHRAELNEVDLPIHRAKWFELSEKLKAEKVKEVSAIKLQKLPQTGVGRGVGGGAPKRGISQAARELGVSHTTLSQDVKIAKLPTAVLETAKETGANRSALLAATTAEWVKLTGEKVAGASCATQPDASGRRKSPQQMPSGINAAVHDLGIDRTEARRCHPGGRFESLKICAICAKVL
jgi:hypothetical protein